MHKSSFTYIEILITLAVMAILFVPMMRLFPHCLYSATISGDMITAVNLSRWEMERVKNLNLTKAQLKLEGDVWTPPMDQPPLENNKSKWRVLRRVKLDSDPLQVDVDVFLANDLKKPVASLVTLVEDNIWAEENNAVPVK